MFRSLLLVLVCAFFTALQGVSAQQDLSVAQASPSQANSSQGNSSQEIVPQATRGQAQSNTDLKSAEETINIIVVSAFNPVLPWSQAVIAGIGEGIKNQKRPINIFVESIYSELENDDASMHILIDSIAVKYQNRQIDALVTDSINGYRFMRLLKARQIFPNANKVLFDVSQSYKIVDDLPTPTNASNGEISKSEIFTSDSIEQQIKDIFTLIPTPKRVVLNKTQGNLFEPHFQALQNYLAKYYPNHELEVWPSEDEADFMQKIAGLQTNDVLIYLPVFSRSTGNLFSPKDYLRKIVAVSPVPVFSFWETFMGAGIVGGYLYSPEIQGESMVRLISAIADGKPVPNNIAAAHWVYDQKVLDKFALNVREQQRNIKYINPNTTIGG